MRRRDWWLLLLAQFALYVAESSAGANVTVQGAWVSVLDVTYIVVLLGSVALAVLLWIRGVRAARAASDASRAHRATYVTRSRRG